MNRFYTKGRVLVLLLKRILIGQYLASICESSQLRRQGKQLLSECNPVY